MGYLGGFLVTLAQVGRRNKLTLEYSGGRENKKGKPQKDEKAPKPERLHGRHVLNRYEDGMEKCIGCELGPSFGNQRRSKEENNSPKYKRKSLYLRFLLKHQKT